MKDVEFVYIVTYKGIDGNHYSTVVKEKSAYDATSKVAACVNGNQHFGMDFKAKLHPTMMFGKLDDDI